MGWRRDDYEIQVSGAEETLLLQLTLGTLVAAGAQIAVPLTYPNQVYCLINVLSEGTTQLSTRIQLAAGHLTTQRQLHWQGTLPISTQDNVLWTFFGPAGTKLRVAMYSINPTLGSTGIPRDPL